VYGGCNATICKTFAGARSVGGDVYEIGSTEQKQYLVDPLFYPGESLVGATAVKTKALQVATTSSQSDPAMGVWIGVGIAVGVVATIIVVVIVVIVVKRRQTQYI